MDIRIGNDILITAKIKDYVETDKYYIKSINAVLVNKDTFPSFSIPTSYTTEVCGNISYNVMPTPIGVHEYHALRWFVNSNPKLTFGVNSTYLTELDNRYWYEPEIDFDKTNNILNMSFPKQYQYMHGPYKLMIFIVLYDESQTDTTNTAVITIDNIFNLIHTQAASRRHPVNICNISFDLDDAITTTVESSTSFMYEFGFNFGG